MESNALAVDICREDPEAVIIYGEKRDEHSETPDYPCFFMNTSLARIVARKRGAGSRCKVFLMREDNTRDSIIFHREFWGEQRSLLERADRVILCEDEVQAGWSVFWDLKRYYI